jgi:hypothetical protein
VPGHPAGLLLAIDDQDVADAVHRQRARRGKPGRTGPDDEDVDLLVARVLAGIRHRDSRDRPSSDAISAAQ